MYTIIISAANIDNHASQLNEGLHDMNLSSTIIYMVFMNKYMHM